MKTLDVFWLLANTVELVRDLLLFLRPVRSLLATDAFVFEAGSDSFGESASDSLFLVETGAASASFVIEY